MKRSPTLRIVLMAIAVLCLDQLAKKLVLHNLYVDQEKILIPGFFKLVHWGNTGAAWSLFIGKNRSLAVVAVAALVVLLISRNYFDAHTKLGQVSLGLIFGGILGNLTDRLFEGHVIDFLYFYIERRGGREIGFPAFNVADSAICIGVGLIFILSWRNDRKTEATAKPAQPLA